MTDQELQAIYEQHCSHEKGLRAVFNAGAETSLDIDDISDEEIAEVMQCTGSCLASH